MSGVGRRGEPPARAAAPDDPHHELGFSDEVLVDEGGRLGARDPRPAPPERDLEAQAVAGRDLPAELGVVDAAEVDAAAVGRRRASAARSRPARASRS